MHLIPPPPPPPLPAPPFLLGLTAVLTEIACYNATLIFGVFTFTVNLLNIGRFFFKNHFDQASISLSLALHHNNSQVSLKLGDSYWKR